MVIEWASQILEAIYPYLYYHFNMTFFKIVTKNITLAQIMVIIELKFIRTTSWCEENKAITENRIIKLK